MNEFIIIVICLFAMILLKIGLNLKFKDIKELNNRKNQELIKMAEKFPSDEQICKKILEQKGRKDVNIKINKEYDSCLYTIYDNTITIGKFKEEYIKIQTIAHECIHACQNKATLWFNFIISNIYNIYFIIICILTIFKKISNTMLLTCILIIIAIIKIVIRMYLENEAMLKAKYEAKEYIEENKILTEDEEEKLLKEYNCINKIGIPFYTYTIINSEIIKIIIYQIISIILLYSI